MMLVTFVLRFWRETSAGEARWRGRIEHVQSGQRADFLDMRDLLGFLEGFGLGGGRPPGGWGASERRPDEPGNDARIHDR